MQLLTQNDNARGHKISAILMVVAILLALAMANSPANGIYHLLHHTRVGFHIGEISYDRPFYLWVNEGLLALFFLKVAAETKVELLHGLLSDRQARLLPAIGAIGGMVAPAAIFLIATYEFEAMRSGWAIPISTDIVLAMGILALMGSAAPAGAKALLAGVAVFDDLGAILIIVFFHSGSVNLEMLIAAILIVALMFSLSRGGLKRLSPYIFLTLVLWAVLLAAGLHATLAGVAAGFLIPSAGDDARASPLARLDQDITPFVLFFVVPLFAFFNAGLVLTANGVSRESMPLALGIILGLLLGKQLGVLGAIWLAVKLRLAKLPAPLDWRGVYLAAVIAGAGFTMSLFFAALAFEAGPLLDVARLAVLIASALATLCAVIALRVWPKPRAVCGQKGTREDG